MRSTPGLRQRRAPAEASRTAMLFAVARGRTTSRSCAMRTSEMCRSAGKRCCRRVQLGPAGEEVRRGDPPRPAGTPPEEGIYRSSAPFPGRASAGGRGGGSGCQAFVQRTGASPSLPTHFRSTPGTSRCHPPAGTAPGWREEAGPLRARTRSGVQQFGLLRALAPEPDLPASRLVVARVGGRATSLYSSMLGIQTSRS